MAEMGKIRQSRIGKSPVRVPDGVEVNLNGQALSVKGPKGELQMDVHPLVSVEHSDSELRFAPVQSGNQALALSGTMRALGANMVQGVSEGYEKQLELVGVGYRVNVKGRVLDLALGYSHPVEYALPEGVEAKAEGQNILILSSADKQVLGQAATEIRQLRPPEVYKGKGVRYRDEHVRLKEAKKK